MVFLLIVDITSKKQILVEKHCLLGARYHHAVTCPLFLYIQYKSSPKPLLHLRAKQRTSPLQKPTCPKCGRIFTQKHSRDDHMRTHTGEKPYICTECNKDFTRKDNLDAHKKRMHEKRSQDE